MVKHSDKPDDVASSDPELRVWDALDAGTHDDTLQDAILEHMQVFAATSTPEYRGNEDLSLLPVEFSNVYRRTAVEGFALACAAVPNFWWVHLRLLMVVLSVAVWAPYCFVAFKGQERRLCVGLTLHISLCTRPYIQLDLAFHAL